MFGGWSVLTGKQFLMDRSSLLLSLVNLSGAGLEIGPSYSPLVPKSSGRRIETLDHASAPELRERYRTAANVDVTKIEEVDYVSDGRPLVEIINRVSYYDYIIASHVIEHTPDMLGFLTDCQTLLKNDGVLVLAVPDKRRCFDVFQPLTSTGVVLQAHLERRSRHLPGQMFDFIAYNALREGKGGWGFGADGPLALAHDLAFAAYGYERARASSAYVDAHAWRFTPSSFRLIINDLNEIGHLKLRERFFAEDDNLEFFVSLSRVGTGCPYDRLALLKMIVVEQQEVSVGPIAGNRLWDLEAVEQPETNIESSVSESGLQPESNDGSVDMGLRIVVSEGDQKWELEPVEFETFPFQSGDELTVIPPDRAAELPISWRNFHIEVGKGRAIIVPPRMEFFCYRGFKIPVHLIELTGAGCDTFELIGKAHIELYQRHIGLEPNMTIVEVGCGIGRDALQLLDVLSENGRYFGVDVVRDSIFWCQKNITPKHPNFTFYHFDAEHELYNPFGLQTSTDFRLPLSDCSVDRIFLASVFTHMLPAEIVQYMNEFRRVLKPSGLIYASFFLHSAEALAAAQIKGNTPWLATFALSLGDGAYANDPEHPRGAVALTEEAMLKMINAAGLRLVKPFLRGWWSGLYDDPEDGQDVAILARAADLDPVDRSPENSSKNG